MQAEALPPQSLDAEESVLGACMMSTKAVEACLDVLEARAFYRESHGHIYKAILALYAKGEAVDAITVVEELTRASVLEEAGGAERVHELASSTPSSSNAKHWANIVRETWLARGLVLAGNEISRLGMERPGPIVDLIAEADAKVIDLQGFLERKSDAIFTGPQLVEMFLAKIAEPPDEMEGVQPPWPFLKPLQPSRLYILAGYQGEGKTAISLQFLKSGCEGGARVGFQSIEMSKGDLTDRLVSLFGVPSEMAQSGIVIPEYQPRLDEAMKTIRSWDFEVIDDEDVTPAGIRRSQRRGKYDLLIIDHLHRIPIRDVRHEREELSSAVRQITNISREFEIPVLLLAQLSRGMKQDPYPRPTRRDLFGASAIENEAAHIWFIWRKRNKQNEAGTDAEFIIDKNRFGPTGWQPMWFHPRQVQFNWGNQGGEE